MINGGGFQGKTETACWAAAAFEDLWRDVYQQLLPGHTPGTRDLFVPVAYCRLPVRATPKALCKTVLDLYGDLRVIAALLCASWPAGQDLLEPAMADLVAGHVGLLRSRAYGNSTPPPEDPSPPGLS